MKAYRIAITRFGTEAERRIFGMGARPRVTELFGDRDNICHPNMPSGSFAQINLHTFATEVAAAHAFATVFSHHASSFERGLYAKHGIRLVETRSNCDEVMAAACDARIERGGLDHIIFLGSDRFVESVARHAMRRGITTELWARSGRIARCVTQVVPRVRIIDHLLTSRRLDRHEQARGMAA
jgi:hypothetical protein